MVFIGIDPGYDRCGFAVLEKRDDGTEHLLHSECFTTERSAPFHARLLAVARRFAELLDIHAPVACGIEHVFFSNNQKTAMRVSEVRGALLYIAGNSGTRIVEYGPNEIKVAVAGDGSASKRQVISMVERLVALPHPIQHDDEYDAIATVLTLSATERG
jgi:Holliday junction resolvasome, endonuclease subunit